MNLNYCQKGINKNSEDADCAVESEQAHETSKKRVNTKIPKKSTTKSINNKLISGKSSN